MYKYVSQGDFQLMSFTAGTMYVCMYVYIHALGREIALPKNPTTGGWWTFEFVGSYISSIPRTESVFWMLAVIRAVQMPTRVVPGPYTCPLKSTL